VYEIYPVSEATVPLIAGATFDVISNQDSEMKVLYHGASANARILNPGIIKSMTASGKTVQPGSFSFRTEAAPGLTTAGRVSTDHLDKSKATVSFDLSATASEATLAVLLTPDTALTVKAKPSLRVTVDGKEADAKSEGDEGRSQWHLVQVQPGKHTLTLEGILGKKEVAWRGHASVWMIAQQQQASKEVSFTLTHEMKERPMPPHPWRSGEVRKSVKLGEAAIMITAGK
jgi:hypothetical protein